MEQRILDILREHGLYEYPYSESAAIDIAEVIEEFYELKKGKYNDGEFGCNKPEFIEPSHILEWDVKE